MVARKPLRDILNKREAIGAFGWTLCMLPTSELAKHAKLSLKEYTNQIIKACYLDKTDPAQNDVYSRAREGIPRNVSIAEPTKIGE